MPHRTNNRPTPRELLQQAADTVTGDRQDDYGEAALSFQRIADLWTAYKGVEFAPHEVALMMALLKISRSVTSDKPDTYVDLAGYAALAATLNSPEAVAVSARSEMVTTEGASPDAA